MSRLCTPAIGLYDSSSSEAIEWQLDGIGSCGFDYLVIELPPINDWSFEVCRKAIDLCFTIADQRNLELGITFLLDATFSADRSGLINAVVDQLKLIRDLKWDRRMPSRGSNALVYVFAPYPDQADALSSRFGGSYDLRFPATFPHWGLLDKSFNEPDLEPYIKNALQTGVSLAQDLGKHGFCQFWSPTQQLRTLNGVASVIPGYDDLHLGRAAQFMPVVPREDGQTLANQFAEAHRTAAEEVLVYSWNEYYEATTIEPSLEYGSYYLDLTRHLITQIRSGVEPCLPVSDTRPQQVLPIYLTSDLERAAKRHADGVPRWDQDDYLSEIRLIGGGALKRKCLIFSDVELANVGAKPWLIIAENAQIRLGAQIIDGDGAVVREGRTELGRDIGPGQTLRYRLEVDVEGLPSGEYTARIDMVWDGRFWFGSSQSANFSLF